MRGTTAPVPGEYVVARAYSRGTTAEGFPRPTTRRRRKRSVSL
jgi:hypothetical protein